MSGNIFNKGLGYFKSTAGRKCGKLTVIRFHKITNDGMIKTIDVTRKQIKTNISFGGRPFMLEKSTKKDFDNAVKKVLNG